MPISISNRLYIHPLVSSNSFFYSTYPGQGEFTRARSQ